ncbi:hypothetical protein [Winogradskyella costae]|uniref:hypothetical protein n=1 Tax=Winogradskyella costae TaxID=2697008 RepID=UPI0015C9BBE1|nr:hypothetical protein [Winogradskyella costae]
MKIQYVWLCFLIGLMMSCGSTERVITKDGNVYEIKGNSIRNNGADVTETLSEKRKSEIASTLKANRKAKVEAETLEDELKAKQKALKEREEAVEEKLDELEERQEALQEKLEAKEDARDEFLKAKKRLEKQQNKYEKLKKKGKLSTNDDTEWSEKLIDLKDALKEATEKMNNLNK